MEVLANQGGVVDQADLNFYFSNVVTIERDSSKVAYEVTHKYVDQLLDHIGQKDPRFGSDPLKVGSAAQRLKVGAPDEYDFGICLEGIPQLHWGTYKPRYFKLVKVESQNGYVTYRYEVDDAHDTVPDNLKVVKSDVPLPAPGPGYTYSTFNPPSNRLWAGKTDMHYEDNFIPFLVRRTFKTLLIQAVRDLGLREHVYVSRKVSGPAITIRIEDRRLKNPVSVDFAPTNRQNMPFPSSNTWPRPNKQWPSRQKVRDAKAKGVNFVAKKDMDWLISYVEPEGELRLNMDEDGGCRAKVHRIMKKIKEDFLCRTSKPVLSSYHLKNILFWECEDHPHSSSWTEDQLAVRFNSMLHRLERCLRERSLKMYFDDNVDLLKDKVPERVQEIDQVIRNIHNFRERSSVLLRSAAEE